MKAFIPTVSKYTQAQIDSGLANSDKAQFIIVVDGSGIPVSPQKIYQGTGNGAAPSTVATSASVAAAVAAITVSDWAAGAVVIPNELRRAVVAAGTIEAGDLIRSNAGRTTGITFDATESANWTEVSPDLVTSVAGRTGAVVLAESDVTNLTTDLAAKAPLASPTFTGTVGGITATMVGLGNVTNTSDANKPVSTAQQTALNLKVDVSTNTSDMALKAPLASPTFTGTVGGVTKTMVGLSNVTNDAQEKSANKDVASGYAGLDATGKVPVARMNTDTAKQDVLVSGTNIKTVGGTSIVGAGDVPVSATALPTNPISATGGVKTTSGSYTVHTFTGSGSFIPNGAINVEYLVVGGGGGGAGGVGGGGGGGRLVESATGLISGSQAITVGAGGTAGALTGPGGVGGTSSIGSIAIAVGGGGGGTNNATGNAGGSGGGGGSSQIGGSATAGASTGGDVSATGYGFNGGTGADNGSIYEGAGGGGAGAVGSNGSPGTGTGGNGGAGRSSSISGSAVGYAGGGGGGTTGGQMGTATDGGGGNGAAGTANKGGGGGSTANSVAGGAGGSGIVIVRYLTSTLILTTPTYSNNAAAIAGGLAVGALYRTNSDPDMLAVVH